MKKIVIIIDGIMKVFSEITPYPIDHKIDDLHYSCKWYREFDPANELLVKVPIPEKPRALLTTEDGVEITNPNQQIFVCYKNLNPRSVGTAAGASYCNRNPENYVYFSTESARDEYILHNKPITVTLREFVIDAGVSRSRYDSYKEFFKLKQSN